MAKLDPTLTFENYVVGPANRLASAAARRAAERPGVSYNPLFIYASSGLGKTHILGAISRHVAKVFPGKRVAYQTAQEFLKDFAHSSDVEDKEEVRERYEELDILLLDDVQFLTAQSEVQELLLLTLDTLTGDGKQVVMASDRPPAEIDGLGAHLRTRFEGGLLVAIGPPEYETRVAIVQKWLEARLQVLDPGVADAIGRFPYETVTEVKSALGRVLEVQDLDDRMVTAEEATAILQKAGEEDLELVDSELGQFLDELSDTVAAKVQAQEAPWRRLLRETAEEVEADGYRADILRWRMEATAPPQDLDELLDGFRQTIRRIQDIRDELEAAGNPWPEAAHGVLRDPERIAEAEALLASARERARPFPEIPEGPILPELSGELPQLVIRAADQLIRTDRPEYNPLFVWSADGAAARALLQAAGRTRLEDQEGAGVALTSVPRFAEEFIHCLSMGVAGAWRERWWSADLLLVDGAQDLSETERAQEEFFHLFEALHRRRARVMVASDRPPSKITALDDRLRARLEGGLVVEVEVEGAELSSTIQEALEEAVAEVELPPRVAEPDIGIEDRAWIMSFQPARPKAGVGSQDEESLGEGESLPVEPLVPSQEEVVWDWPKLEDRLVEELE